MGPYVETTESATPTLLVLPQEPTLVRTTLCGVDTSSYGLTALQRVQPGEPVAGNPLGGFCEGGRAQERCSRPVPTHHNLDKSWLIKFVEHRVADPRILRLIQKWLNAGVMEEGKWSEMRTGTPQGSVISPTLANIYLHYTFDLWVNVWRTKYAQGDVVVVRYADDIVLGFQHQAEADRFLEKFRERLGKFGLELHPDKTRRIEFGRYAEQNRERRGEERPETFDFLGFTHISGKNGKGYFTVKRRTIRKRMRGRLQQIAATPQAHARSSATHRRMAQVGRAGLLQLPRGTGEHGQSKSISSAGDPPLATNPALPQPNAPSPCGPNVCTRETLASRTARAPSLSRAPLRR
jgi:hypothetical protein